MQKRVLGFAHDRRNASTTGARHTADWARNFAAPRCGVDAGAAGALNASGQTPDTTEKSRRMARRCNRRHTLRCDLRPARAALTLQALSARPCAARRRCAPRRSGRADRGRAAVARLPPDRHHRHGYRAAHRPCMAGPCRSRRDWRRGICRSMKWRRRRRSLRERAHRLQSSRQSACGAHVSVSRSCPTPFYARFDFMRSTTFGCGDPAMAGAVSSEPGPAREASGVRAPANRRRPATQDIASYG